MAERMKRMMQTVRATLLHCAAAATNGVHRNGAILLATCLAGAAGYGLWTHPPLSKLIPGRLGIRTNQLTGATAVVRDGAVLLVPGAHALRRYRCATRCIAQAGAIKSRFSQWRVWRWG